MRRMGGDHRLQAHGAVQMLARAVVDLDQQLELGQVLAAVMCAEKQLAT